MNKERTQWNNENDAAVNSPGDKSKNSSTETATNKSDDMRNKPNKKEGSDYEKET